MNDERRNVSMRKKMIQMTACVCTAAVLLAGCGTQKETETIDLTQVTLDEIIEGAKEEGSHC